MRAALAVVLCAGFFFVGAAGAQDSGARTRPLPAVDLSRLDLNPGAQDSLFTATGRLNAPGNLRIAFSGLYLNQPSVTRLWEGAANARLDSRFTLIGSVAWTPNDRLELYGNLPFVMYQRELPSLSRFGFAEVSASGLAQPLIGARISALREGADAPVNLAVGIASTLPMGSVSALGSEPLMRFQPGVSVGKTFGDLTVGAEVRARFRSQENFAFRGLSPLRNQGDTVTHELGAGLTASYRVSDKLRANVDVLGDMSLQGGASGGGTLQPFLSARYQAMEGMEAYAAVGGGFGKLVGTANHQILAGIAFTGLGLGGTRVVEVKQEPKPEPKKVVDPNTLDDDRDGLVNRDDACPKQAEDRDGYQDEDGCPDEDNDGDGVPDSKDTCPDKKGQPENAGCPPKDADNDGVADVADRCPNEPGTVAEGGCPIRDGDADGVRDELDMCPKEAGTEALRGCPVRDTDGDGVTDEIDNCIREKGTKENAGCPPKTKQLVTITREKLIISDKVYFATNKSAVLAKSRKLLDQIAKIIKEHPEIPKIRVEGHTDNVGTPEKNMKLSEDRAKSVHAYLIKAGVASERLEAKGYGQEKPIADNGTAEGREVNRRVEFFIVEAPAKTDGGGVEPEPLVK